MERAYAGRWSVFVNDEGGNLGLINLRDNVSADQAILNAMFIYYDVNNVDYLTRVHIIPQRFSL